MALLSHQEPVPTYHASQTAAHAVPIWVLPWALPGPAPARSPIAPFPQIQWGCFWALLVDPSRTHPARFPPSRLACFSSPPLTPLPISGVLIPSHSPSLTGNLCSDAPKSPSPVHTSLLGLLTPDVLGSQHFDLDTFRIPLSHRLLQTDSVPFWSVVSPGGVGCHTTALLTLSTVLPASLAPSASCVRLLLSLPLPASA